MSKTKITKQAIALIKEAGGEYMRRGKHGDLFKLPSGAVVQFSHTTSDGARALKNLRCELRRLTCPS